MAPMNRRRGEHAAGAADADGQAGRDHLADQQDEQERRCAYLPATRVAPAPGSRRRTSAAAAAADRPSSSPPTAGRTHSGPRQTQSQASSIRYSTRVNADADRRRRARRAAAKSRYSARWCDGEGRQLQERGVAERGPADHARGHRGQHDHAEGLGGEVAQDQLHREEHPGERRVERGGDAAGGAAGDQQPHPVLGAPGPAGPSVEPSAEPICTIGPSRPTDPPPPMHSAEASALTTATCGRDPAAAAGDRVHHLGHAVAAGLAGEAVHQRPVEQAGDDRGEHHEPAAQPGHVRVGGVPGGGVVRRGRRAARVNVLISQRNTTAPSPAPAPTTSARTSRPPLASRSEAAAADTAPRTARGTGTAAEGGPGKLAGGSEPVIIFASCNTKLCSVHGLTTS